MKKIMLNNDWLFGVWGEENSDLKPIRLPHSVATMPLHYSDPEQYEGTWRYQRVLPVCRQASTRYILHFEGVAQQAEVYVNDVPVGRHRCGYTAFALDITESLYTDRDSLLKVKVDSHEDPAIPPFGFVIDYLTYGGIYRDVWLEETPEDAIERLAVFAGADGTLRTELTYRGTRKLPLHYRVLSARGVCIFQGEEKGPVPFFQQRLSGIENWSHETPVLYTLEVTYGDDVHSVSFGFRSITFDDNHLYVNGRPVFLQGLNRHQAYPYVGYAMPHRLQAEDARILKEELHVNTVRTSHYPQDQSFLDACDQLGLYVITEIPGWQHIGDAAWKKQALQNTRDMILQNINHPGILMWGVRINESQDDDAFYQETNALAHALDASRPTTGVRYLENSSLLEDIYAYNDFSHDGVRPGCRKKKSVMKQNRPLLISEANGHMFPTKASDPSLRRQQHALRHAAVLDCALKDRQHIGCIQWCMFDYATHSDFGSGDAICYHGVMDAFRNPKPASYVYAGQQEEETILEVTSSMDIGDYDGGYRGDVYALTNADEVKLYKNDRFVQSFYPQKTGGLAHPPVCIDDTIGRLLESEEGFDPQTARRVSRALKAIEQYGVNHLPLAVKLDLAGLMLRHHFTFARGAELYAKYIGGWGGKNVRWRFEAWRHGKMMRSIERGPSHKLHLDVRCSHTVLYEGDTYDVAALRVRILNEYGMTCAYAQIPVRLQFEDETLLESAGPRTTCAEGGMTGFYVRTKGRLGKTKLTVSAKGCEDVAVEMEIKEECEHA